MASGLLDDTELLPEPLKNCGYRTFGVGKWHLGYSKSSQTPWGRGFEKFTGYLGMIFDSKSNFLANHGPLFFSQSQAVIEKKSRKPLVQVEVKIIIKRKHVKMGFNLVEG